MRLDCKARMHFLLKNSFLEEFTVVILYCVTYVQGVQISASCMKNLGTKFVQKELNFTNRNFFFSQVYLMQISTSKEYGGKFK